MIIFSNDCSQNEIATARCFRYDARFDRWYDLAAMNEPRKDFVLVAVGYKLYIPDFASSQVPWLLFQLALLLRVTGFLYFSSEQQYNPLFPQSMLQTIRTQVRSDMKSIVMCHAQNLEHYTLKTKRRDY
jgi:hypothetical protein